MSHDLLHEQQHYLAQLLEAIQRCAWFLHRSDAKINWPIDPEWLSKHKKDVDLFETLAAINERFAKLQDSIASAMRHSALLGRRAIRHLSQGAGLLRETGRHRRHQRLATLPCGTQHGGP